MAEFDRKDTIGPYDDGDHADHGATDEAPTEQLAPAAGSAPMASEVDEGESAGSSDEDNTPAKPWYRRGGVIAGAAVVVLAGLYVGGAALLSNRTPAGAEVLGTSIGSMSQAQAVATLTPVAEEKLAQKLDLTIEDQKAELVPQDAGLSIDVPATVNKLTGFTLNPVRLYQRLFGGAKVEPVVATDEAALKASLESVAQNVAVEPVDAAVTFEDGKPVITEPVDGKTVDVEAAQGVVEKGFIEGSSPLALPVIASAPAVDAQALAKTKESVLDPLASGPVTVKAGDISAELSPEQIGRAATVDVANATLTLDGTELKKTLAEVEPKLASTGKDATVVMEGGKPVVKPSESGKGIDADDAANAIAKAAVSTDRTASVEMTEADAEFTTEDAQKLGIKEVIGEFDTPLTADKVRTTNLIVGTKTISNTLIKPGETFSLLETLGPVTPERGFVSSGVVDGGFATKALGGGLSQLSTTTMNAAFFAGMDLVEFRQHTRYFDRYPEGREATMWGPSIDMKWKNSTDYGVLVDAYVADNRVHVRLWGTKVYEVKDWTSERRNITSPQVVYNNRPDCKPENGRTPGFTVDFGRERYKNGTLVDKQKWTWTYSAWPIVRCGSPNG
ncbi:MAG: VanW family protein, partial [Bowdeniella nasicola]|nr:VanW family protein [Bowdeniella nasicola]